jgi:hypothetical protein
LEDVRVTSAAPVEQTLDVQRPISDYEYSHTSHELISAGHPAVTASSHNAQLEPSSTELGIDMAAQMQHASGQSQVSAAITESYVNTYSIQLDGLPDRNISLVRGEEEGPAGSSTGPSLISTPAGDEREPRTFARSSQEAR